MHAYSPIYHLYRIWSNTAEYRGPSIPPGICLVSDGDYFSSDTIDMSEQATCMGSNHPPCEVLRSHGTASHLTCPGRPGVVINCRPDIFMGVFDLMGL